MVFGWDEDSAVIVLRIDDPKALPEGLLDNEEEVALLSDGAFLLPGGHYGKGGRKRALEAMEEPFAFGAEPLAFHQDPRGVRWARLGEFIDRPWGDFEVPGRGTIYGLELDYESAVGG